MWTVTVSLAPKTAFQYKFIRKETDGSVSSHHLLIRGRYRNDDSRCFIRSSGNQIQTVKLRLLSPVRNLSAIVGVEGFSRSSATVLLCVEIYIQENEVRRYVERRSSISDETGSGSITLQNTDIDWKDTCDPVQVSRQTKVIKQRAYLLYAPSLSFVELSHPRRGPTYV